VCGIVGFVGFNAPSKEGRIRKMIEVQSYRGPDARGVVSFNQCILGHLRLSIIDRNQAANQPFVSHNSRYCMTYNGELYNYKEVREELQKKGYKFTTVSDTEVVLVAWEAWGNKCLNKFIGMFAFAIWDKKNNILFCARDRFGIKPFNYTVQNNEFWFSSEIKGLLAAGVERKPDIETWATYLRFAKYDHTPNTFFKGIKRLKQGHYIEVKLDNAHKIKIKQKCYWFPSEPFSNVDPNINYKDACASLRSLLLNTVDLHLRADVPCGILVSGGVDSAVVLAGSREAQHKNIQGFHHYFPDPYSELPWVKELVDFYNVDMCYYKLESSKVEQNFNYYLWHFEEPFGSLVSFALGPLYEAAHQVGVGVFLDGNGADDIFGGYRQHQMAHIADLRRHGKGKEFKKAVYEASQHWAQPKELIVKQVNLILNNTKQQYGFDMTNPVVDYVINPAIKGMELPKCESIKYDSILSTNLINGLMQTKIPRNTRFYDRISMSFSNEHREPLLDHRLSEFVSTIPADYLFQKGYTKSIFRDSMKGLVPDKVLYAKKREIQSPQREWLGKPLKGFIEDILSSDSFFDRGLVDGEKTIKYYKNYLKEQPSNSFALWQWINMEMWHRQFIDSSLDEICQQPVLKHDFEGFNNKYNT